MVMVLEQTMVNEIARFGRLRAPNEACGLLIPVPIQGRWVWELPNRSSTPATDFEMHGEDMLLLLESLYKDHNIIEEMVPGLAVWHTHPQGNVGPSLFDLRNKPANFRSLVVSLNDKGGDLASWY